MLPIMKDKIDFTDIVFAAALFVIGFGVSSAAALPYPHPSVWPILDAADGLEGILVGAGKIIYALLFALVYLVLRALRPERRGDLPGVAFAGRLVSFSAAAALGFWPQIFRAGQFFDVEIAAFEFGIVGFALWHFGRLGVSNGWYALGVFLLSLATGLDPRGIIPLVFVTVADVYARWVSAQEGRSREDEVVTKDLRQRELICSLLAVPLGLVVGFGLTVVGAAWLLPWQDRLVSPSSWILLGAIPAGVMGMGAARRVRRMGFLGIFLAQLSVLSILAVDGFLVRNIFVAQAEREMLVLLKSARALPADRPIDRSFAEAYLRGSEAYNSGRTWLDEFVDPTSPVMRRTLDDFHWRAARDAEACGDFEAARAHDRANRTLQERGRGYFVKP